MSRASKATNLQFAVELLEDRLTPTVTISDVPYAATGNAHHVLDLQLPDNYQNTSKLATVVWIHGGGWWHGDEDEWAAAQQLVDRGFAVASVDYRLTSDPGSPQFPAPIHDVKGAVRWLRANAAAYNLDPDQFGAMGESAGGHLAALLGTTGGVTALEGTIGGNLQYSSRVQAVAEFFAPTDLYEWWQVPGYASFASSVASKLIGATLSQNEALADAASPISYVTADDPPFLIYHGTGSDKTGDGAVPWQQSQLFYDELKLRGVLSDLHLVTNANHSYDGIVTGRPTTPSEIAAFFDEHLRNAQRLLPPTGIYVNGDPTSNQGPGSVTADLVDKPYVEGFLVRIGWEDVEPSNNQYQWSALDAEIAEATAGGKKVTLALVNGPAAPAWLFAAGAQGFDFQYQNLPETMPVPWDATYLAEWTEIVGKFGERYANNPTVSLVHVTNATADGFKMQIPSTTTDVANWNDNGYSTSKVINSWKTSIDAFAKAFPLKPLDVEVSAVLNAYDVPNMVMHYASDNFQQIGAFAAWWSQKNTETLPTAWAIFQQGMSKNFGTVQFVTNVSNDPDGFGNGGIQGAINLAYNSGIRYMEISDEDLRNVVFDSMFTNLAGQLADPAPPQATLFQVNNGLPQRSRVSSLTVAFNGPIYFPSGYTAAFQLGYTGPLAPVANIALAFSQAGSAVTIFFNDPITAPGGLLRDGRYTLTLVAPKIRGSGGFLDGNGNGVGGDLQTFSFHRLFGDVNGDATVDAIDFAAFGSAFGSSTGFANFNADFDFDNNGNIDSSDLAQFGLRFGITL